MGSHPLAPPQNATTEVPVVPPDYYERIHEVEQLHPWHLGMRAISAALLGERLRRDGQRLLDAGCGTGGFLRWALAGGSCARACGTDVSAEAITLARGRVPAAVELHVASLRDLPFASDSFDLVTVNDVLQHVPEPELGESVAELTRVLAADGALLVRTNGAWRPRAEAEWRTYSRAGLRSTLERSGLRCERITYANLVGSLWALVRGRAPRAPSDRRHGIPRLGGRRQAALAFRLLEAEARYLARATPGLPYGHTLFAVATKRR